VSSYLIEPNERVKKVLARLEAKGIDLFADTSQKSRQAASSGSRDEFLSRLNALMNAVGGVKADTHVRSRAEQADLYRRKPGLAARPGHSKHEVGIAADVSGNKASIAKMHALAPKYGLRFPMDYEPWHIQL